MRKTIAAVAASMFLPTAALAAGPSGQISAFLHQAEVSVGAGSDADGVGPGLKGWISTPGGVFGHFEFSTATLDVNNSNVEIDLDTLRLGGGYFHSITKATGVFGFGELVDFGGDFDEGGFGIHGGVHHMFAPMVSGGATLGYLLLDDTDGIELSFNGRFHFNRQLSAFMQFRTYMGSVDGGGDFDVTSIQAGGSFGFGM